MTAPVSTTLTGARRTIAGEHRDAAGSLSVRFACPLRPVSGADDTLAQFSIGVTLQGSDEIHPLGHLKWATRD